MSKEKGKVIHAEGRFKAVSEGNVDIVEVDSAKKILDKIEEYSKSNQNIVKSVNEIDAEIKRLADLKQQYVNLALSNNGALNVLNALIAKDEVVE